MINSSETMREGLAPVASAFFSTSRAALTPSPSPAGFANGDGEEAARLKEKQ